MIASESGAQFLDALPMVRRDGGEMLAQGLDGRLAGQTVRDTDIGHRGVAGAIALAVAAEGNGGQDQASEGWKAWENG